MITHRHGVRLRVIVAGRRALSRLFRLQGGSAPPLRRQRSALPASVARDLAPRVSHLTKLKARDVPTADM